MRTMKKLIVIAMLLLPLFAHAEEVEIDGLWYNLNAEDMTAEVIRCKGEQYYYGDVIIPNVILYKDVEYEVTAIKGAFAGCFGLTSITIPKSVKSLRDFAFDSCSNLTSVHITDLAAWCNISFSNSTSNPLHNIMSPRLFVNGEEIVDLVIPNNVTCINDYAFLGYSGLSSVSIPDKVAAIGNNVFEDCDELTLVSIGSGVTSIGCHAFTNCKKLTTINIPDNVTTIGDYAFSGCQHLNSITILDGVTAIGEGMFGDCIGLTNIYLPNSVTTIGRAAFIGCLALNSINIPNNVTTIGDDAFCSCISLTTFSLPNSVTSIGNGAFYACIRLTDFYCYAESVPSTSSNVFLQTHQDLCTLHVPPASLEAYKATAPWSDFKNIVPLTDEETGIPEVKQIAEKKGKEGIVYDLSGRRVANSSEFQGSSKLTKGVYIQGGKKVVVK